MVTDMRMVTRGFQISIGVTIIILGIVGHRTSVTRGTDIFLGHITSADTTTADILGGRGRADGTKNPALNRVAGASRGEASRGASVVGSGYDLPRAAGFARPLAGPSPVRTNTTIGRMYQRRNGSFFEFLLTEIRSYGLHDHRTRYHVPRPQIRTSDFCRKIE